MKKGERNEAAGPAVAERIEELEAELRKNNAERIEQLQAQPQREKGNTTI